MTRCVRKVREHILTGGARETGGGPFNGALYRESAFAVDESEEHLGCCLRPIRNDRDP
jgi:hypothetical protein